MVISAWVTSTPNLVEFGCGTGFYPQVLAAKAGRAVATDVWRGMLALATDNIKAASGNELSGLLGKRRFQVVETCRSSNIPVEYITAVKL
jgi:cyclopropane fatty-acyl-phospholipid synthase-like methyltransferase